MIMLIWSFSFGLLTIFDTLFLPPHHVLKKCLVEPFLSSLQVYQSHINQNVEDELVHKQFHKLIPHLSPTQIQVIVPSRGISHER